MQPATTENTTVTTFPVPWAVKLIDRLHTLYGSKFMQQWDGISKPKLASAWAEELQGFSGNEVAIGLAACRTRPWPPTLPEFMALCRPWLDPETAFREAVVGMSERNGGGTGQWSHPAVYWAAVRIGAHDLLNTGWLAIRGRWEAALRNVMSQGHWKEIPAPSVALPAPGSTLPTQQEKQRFLRQMKETTGSSKLTGADRVKNPKAWAYAILANPEGKTLAVVQMARRAVASGETQ